MGFDRLIHVSGSSHRSKPKIMVFCRPYLVQDFREMLSPLSGTYDFQYTTDGRKTNVTSFAPGFYKHLNNKTILPELTGPILDEVVTRCRMLRNLDRSRAEALVQAMACSISEVFDALQPKLLFSQVTDEYVAHTVSLVAALRGIPVTQYCHSYFDNRMYLSQYAHGVPLNVDEPPVEEVIAAISRIGNTTHRQNYNNLNSYGRATHVFRYFRYQAKRLYFLAKGMLERDPLNVHYAITPYLAERKRVSDYPDPALFSADWKAEMETEKPAGKGMTVYMPLAYTPESTVDYWIADRRFVDYEATTLKILQTLTEDSEITVLVKEHFHMLGMRRPSFYKSMSALERVIHVPPAEFSNEVLVKADCVLLGGGSAGVEATVHGKPVITYTDTSYWFRPSEATYVSLNGLTQWPNLIREAVDSHIPIKGNSLESAISEMMKSTISVRAPGKVWPWGEASGLDKAIALSLERKKRANPLHSENTAETVASLSP